jgi:hypothetical protein
MAKRFGKLKIFAFFSEFALLSWKKRDTLFDYQEQPLILKKGKKENGNTS